MSAGYFSRLAQRAHGERGGIRPVVAPLYAGQAGLFETEAEVGGRVETSRLPVVSSPMTDQPNRERGLPVQPGAATLHPVETRTVETHTRVIREEVRAETVRQSAPPEERPPAVPARAGPVQPIDPPARPPKDAKAPEGEDDLQRQPARVAPVPPAPEPARADSLLLPLQPPEKTTARPAEREASHAPEGAEPEPPSLRIHIGRIEVRAVQPPPPAPAPRVDPHPAMSLDEYLRRLNEERR
ncbi:MAG TPA: hypothetical protein PJ988_18615 [Anaerolinea sp.]|nr:hypothetical protein [Anaerolinea sp.]